MADDWEDDDWASAPVVAPAARVVGGGAAVAVSAPDDWEEEDSVPEPEPVEAAAAPKPSAPMKQSKRLAVALKEKESAMQAAAVERAMRREEELAAMDEASRKLEMQKIVEASDLDNARDLFMGADKPASTASAVPRAGDNLDTLEPTTDAELARYAKILTDKCRKFNKDSRRTARYMVFVKEVVRGLTADLDADDAKEIATHMSTISNVKLEEVKKARGGKKKPSKKANVRVALDQDDDMRSASYVDEYDEFM
jgi:translation initiation factor 3 subunit J